MVYSCWLRANANRTNQATPPTCEVVEKNKVMKIVNAILKWFVLDVCAYYMYHNTGGDIAFPWINIFLVDFISGSFLIYDVWIYERTFLPEPPKIK